MLEEDFMDAVWESQDNYEFLCLNPDCDFTTHDKTELKACINCGRPYCSGCLAEIGVEVFCADCATCRVCHSEALYYCDRGCGALLCPDHVHEISTLDDATGYRDTELVCGKCNY